MNRSSVLAVLVSATVLASCVPDLGGSRGVSVEVWFHEADGPARRVIEAELLRFNRAQSEVTALLRILPEGDYDDQVEAAFTEERQPDLLAIHPLALAGRGLSGELVRLDEVLPARLVDDLREDTRRRGTVRGRLLGVPLVETATVIVADRDALAAVGARIPADPAQAWTAVEFERILSDLAAAAADEGPLLDLRADLGEPWLAIAYAGFLASFGGGLGVTPPDGPAGLAGPGSLRFAERLQRWSEVGWLRVAAAPPGPEPGVPLAVVPGEAVAQYAELLGDALGVAPVPDFGNGSRAVMWAHPWVIPRGSEQPEAAATVLAFLMEPDVADRLAVATGGLAGSATASAGGAGAPVATTRILAALVTQEWTEDPPGWPAGSEAAKTLAAGFEAVLAGEDPGEALRASARDLASVLDAAVTR